MSENGTPFWPVAITGMHRSGTSMITRGLHESGLHLIGGVADALLAAADDNPEGFWENKAIVACNDDLLEAAGGAWDNPPALLPQAVDDPRLAEVVEPASTALAGLRENAHWGFKDPRLCLTAAFWLDLQPDLRFVICVRNPLEVALSLKRRNQNSYSLGLLLWEQYYASILDLVPPQSRIITHYDSYFLDPAGELGRVCDFVGLTAAELNVRRELRHHDVGVSLDEANLSRTSRDLYRELCAEAGSPIPPSTVVDEGQVRRLVLDGSVAARHAEQRQQAIDRLEERLAESQNSEKELKIELARVRRESESRKVNLEHVQGEFDRLRTDTSGSLDALLEGQGRIVEQNRRVVDTTDTIAEMSNTIRGTTERLVDGANVTNERLAHVGAITDAIHVKLRAVEDTVASGFFASLTRRVRRVLGRGVRRVARPSRRVVGSAARRGVPAAKRTAKATVKRLPSPVGHNLRRVRRAVADGQAGKRLEERGNRIVARLPAPAQSAARKSGRAVKRSGAVPLAIRAAKGVNRRLPAGAQKAIREMTTPAATGRRPVAPAKKAAPAPRPKQTADGRAVDVPKGPAAFKWQKGYERLVTEFVDPDTMWAVVTPGSKGLVDTVGSRRATVFPAADGSAPAADSLALIATLEALRVGGADRLVLPEGSRLWFREHPELRDHVARHHATLADRESAGVVFDLSSDSVVDRRGLLAEVNDLAADLDAMPAVLDWTALDIAGELPGFTTFAPPTPDSLPYFDDSVEVVVTTTDHDRAEAIRVSSVGVITVESVDGHPVVRDVHASDDSSSHGPSVVVVAPAGNDPRLAGAIAERVAECGATLIADIADTADIADGGSAGADAVVRLEPGVLPLPGAITLAAVEAVTSPSSLVVAKVLDGSGRIENAGAMVFADGGVAGIAAGTLEVRAPWHEFVRPVHSGWGLLAASAALLDAVPVSAEGSVVDWCGEVWASGRTVSYLPKAVVVRTAVDYKPRIAAGDVWDRVVGRRPERPDSLSDGVWRFLLADHDPATVGQGARR